MNSLCRSLNCSRPLLRKKPKCRRPIACARGSRRCFSSCGTGQPRGGQKLNRDVGWSCFRRCASGCRSLSVNSSVLSFFACPVSANPSFRFDEAPEIGPCELRLVFSLVAVPGRVPTVHRGASIRVKQPLFAVQHSTKLTASPPSDVSLYFDCMSAPVWGIVARKLDRSLSRRERAPWASFDVSWRSWGFGCLCRPRRHRRGDEGARARVTAIVRPIQAVRRRPRCSF